MKSRGPKGDLILGLKRLRPDADLRDALAFGGIAAAGNGISTIYPPGLGESAERIALREQ